MKDKYLISDKDEARRFLEALFSKHLAQYNDYIEIRIIKEKYGYTKFRFTKDEEYLAQYNFLADMYLLPSVSNREFIEEKMKSICQQIK